MKHNARLGTQFLLLCLGLTYGISVIHRLESGFTFAKYDPGWMVTTVISIANDGDLDLRNQLNNDPIQASDQTAQGSAGQWYPLHEYLMAFATVPFYLLFGIPGCLAFNVLVVILLMIILYDLCCREVDHRSAFISVLLTGFTPLFYDYSYSYSIDVFGACLLVASYWGIVNQKWTLSGFIWGLAVFARLFNIITAPAFGTFLILEANIAVRQRNQKHCRRLQTRTGPIILFLLGVLPLAVCMGLSNWQMFGSPLSVSYNRWQHFVDGRAVLSSQSNVFTASMIERLPAVLFDIKEGLFFGAPLLLVALPLGLRSFWRHSKNETILFGLICVSMIIFFSKYTLWISGGGNRYLMSVVALGTLPLSFAVRQALSAAAGEPK